MSVKQPVSHEIINRNQSIEKNHYTRINPQGIKVISFNSNAYADHHYQNQLQTNQQLQDHYHLSKDSQGQNQGGRIKLEGNNATKALGKGISVCSSSRKSSTERPYSSREKSYSNNNNNNKSETYISSFTEIEKQSDSGNQAILKNHQEDSSQIIGREEVERIQQHFSERFASLLHMQSEKYTQSLQELNFVICQNSQKIHVLQENLMILQKKCEKRQKQIQRLQSKLQNVYTYNEQCWDYTSKRIRDLQIIEKMLNEQCCKLISKHNYYEVKTSHMEYMVKDIFEMEMERSYLSKQKYEAELIHFSTKINHIAEKSDMSEFRMMLEVQTNYRNAFINHLQNYKDQLHAQYHHCMIQQSSIAHHSLSLPDLPNNSTSVQILKEKLTKLQRNILNLEYIKTSFVEMHINKEQHAQNTIWQLSNLINKEERENQKLQKEVQELNAYVKLIQNKLFLLSNSKSQGSNDSLKFVQKQQSQITVKQQYQRQIFKVKEQSQIIKDQSMQVKDENFKLKVQNMHIKDQNLRIKDQNINIKDQIMRIKDQNMRLKDQSMLINKQRNDSESEMNNKLHEENNALKTKINEQKCLIEQDFAKAEDYEDTIDQLLKRIQAIEVVNCKIKSENDKIISINSQLFEENQSLLEQNEHLEQKIAEYCQVFNQQSQTFKTAIEHLRQEKQLLQVELRNCTQRTVKQNNISDCNKHQKRSIKNEIKLIRQNIAKQEEYQNNCVLRKLRGILEEDLKLALPVLCQMDGRGYLKLHSDGRYLYDENQNVFEIKQQELNSEEFNNLIQIVNND